MLEEDQPLFDFAKDRVRLIPVPERYRAPIRNLVCHQVVLPWLAAWYRWDVLHIPSYRRRVWRRVSHG